MVIYKNILYRLVEGRFHASYCYAHVTGPNNHVGRGEGVKEDARAEAGYRDPHILYNIIMIDHNYHIFYL